MSETLGSLVCGSICIGMAFLAVIGVVVIFYLTFTRSRKKVVIQPNWPTVTGQVTAAKVEETVRTRPDDDVFFYPSIEFEYTVDGQIFTGKQAAGKPTNLEFMAKRTLSKYPPGTEVVVYYDPKIPKEVRLLLK